MIHRCVLLARARHFSDSLVVRAPPQGLIVRYPKEPPGQVLARAPLLKMTEECKEDLLQNVLPVVSRETKGYGIAKQWVAQ